MAYRDTRLLGRTFGSLDHRSRWLWRALNNQLNRNDAQQPNFPLGFSAVPGVYDGVGSVTLTGEALVTAAYANYNGSGTLVVGGHVNPFVVVKAVENVSPAFTMQSSVGGPAQQHIVRAPLSSVWWLFFLSSGSVAIDTRTSPDLLEWKDSTNRANTTIKEIEVAADGTIGHDENGRQLNVTLDVLGGKEIVHAVVVSKTAENRSDNTAFVYDMRAVVSGDVVTWDAGENIVDQNSDMYQDGVPESPGVLVRGDGTLVYITTHAGNPLFLYSDTPDTGSSSWTPQNITVGNSLEIVNNFSKCHYIGKGSSPTEWLAIWQSPGNAPDTAFNMRAQKHDDTSGSVTIHDFFTVIEESPSRRYAFCQDNAGFVYGFRIGSNNSNTARKFDIANNSLSNLATTGTFPTIPAGITPHTLAAAYDGRRYVVVFLSDTANTVWACRYDTVGDTWVNPWWDPLFSSGSMTLESISTVSINNNRGNNAIPVMMQFGDASSDIWVGGYMLEDDFGVVATSGQSFTGEADASMVGNGGSSFDEVMTGSITITGTAAQQAGGVYDATGTTTLTGLASQLTSGVYVATGTTTLTGLASQLTSGVYEATGGLVVTGLASQQVSVTDAATGGVTVTGLSSQQTSGVYDATGGESLTGTMTASQGFGANGTGAFAVTGESSQQASGLYAAAGSASITGLSSERTSGLYAATGVLTVTGLASQQVGVMDAAIGSITVTGLASQQTSGVYDAVGSIRVTGLASQQTSVVYDAAGATTLTGLSSQQTSGLYDANGGTSITGVMTASQGFGVNGTGAFAITGLSSELTSGLYAATGDLTVTGLASQQTSGVYHASGATILTGLSSQQTSGTYDATGEITGGGTSSERTGGVYHGLGGGELYSGHSLSGSVSTASTGGISLSGSPELSGGVATDSQGGISAGGTAGVAASYDFLADGGNATGGQAAPYLHKGLGFVSLSGEADTQSSTQASQTGQGGLTLTGTPNLVASYAYQAGGDVSAGGSATPAASYGDQPGLGATSITGSADLQVGYAHVPSGGHYLSGDAALAATYAYATAGSLSVTGEATERTEGSYAGTAGITLGGIANQQTSGVFGSAGEASASGTAVVAASYYYAGDGYLAASGSATPQAGASPQLGGGGLAATGSAQLDAGMAWAADGGTSLSGTPFLAASYAGYQGSGAVTFSGFADGQGANSYSTTMNGGLSFSGSCLRGGTVSYLASGDVVPIGEALQALSAVAETVAGPTSLSGSSGVSAGMAWASSGGTAVSGSAESRTGGIAGGSGGSSLAGGHVAYATALVNGTGGASLSGAALVYGTATFAASGELAVGGVGHAGVLFLVDGSGVLSLGGLSPVYATMAYGQAGSCSLSGSALVAVSVSHAAAGGVSMSGTATASAALSAESFGGVALHGVGAYGVSAAVGGNGVFRVEGEAVARIDLGGVASLGGTSLAGSAGTRSSGLFYGEGDQAVRGEAAYVVSGRNQASGTCLIGGSADATQGFYLEGGGTLTASGTAGTPSIGYVFQADGGFAASSEDTFRWAVEASGGLVFSGVNIVALPSYEREGGGSLGLSGKSYCHLTTGRLILWESSSEPDKGHSSAAGNSLAMAVAAGTAAGSIVPGPESGGRPDELPQAAAATGNSLADTIAAAAAAQRKAAAVTPVPPSGGRTMSLSAA